MIGNRLQDAVYASHRYESGSPRLRSSASERDGCSAANRYEQSTFRVAPSRESTSRAGLLASDTQRGFALCWSRGAIFEGGSAAPPDDAK